MPTTTATAPLTPWRRVLLLTTAGLAWAGLGVHWWLVVPTTSAWGSLTDTVHYFTYLSALLVGVSFLLRAFMERRWHQPGMVGWRVVKRAAEISSLVAGVVYWLLIYEGMHEGPLYTVEMFIVHLAIQVGVVACLVAGGLTDHLSLLQRLAAVALLLSYAAYQVVAQVITSAYASPYDFLDLDTGWASVAVYLTIIALTGTLTAELINLTARRAATT